MADPQISDNPRGQHDLAQLWATEYSRFRTSRDKIAYCGQWRRREIRPHIPQGWENPEAFEVMLPHATTLGQDVINFLGRKRPAAHRQPGGAGPTAERLASKVEKHVQEAMDNALKSSGEDLWEALLSHATNDGEFAVIVSPRTAFWSDLLEFTVDADDGQQMLDGSGNPVIAPAFERDSKGRGRDDPYFSEKPARQFKLDRGKSSDAYQEYQRDAKAKKLPVVVRIIPAPMCQPIGLDSHTGKLDALLIKSQRTALSLQRDGFQFTLLGPEVPQPIYGAANLALAGAGTTLTLYELHLPGKVIYQIEGPHREKYAATLGDQTEAIVDLEAEFGLCEVPGGYFYGGHHANETDPGKKGIPFLDAFISLIRGANQTATAKVAHTFRFAFGGKGLKLAPELLGAWQELGHPADFKIEPMKIQILPGDLQDLTDSGVGRDADTVIDFAMGVLERLSPTSSIKGDSGDGGFSQGVSMASAEHMLRQILEGSLAAWKCIASWELAIVAAISRNTGEAVPIYVTVRSPKKGDKPKVTTLLELGHDDLQGDYTIDATISQPKFQNLALMQAGAGFVEANLISETTWLEEIAGFEQPDEEQDKKWVEAQLKTPEGQNYVLELAAKKKGNQELQTLAKLQQQGQATPGGLPSSAVPPRPGAGPTGVAGPVPAGQQSIGGPGSGNPAASALAGIMGGQLQTQAQSNVIQATGQGAPVAA